MGCDCLPDDYDCGQLTFVFIFYLSFSYTEVSIGFLFLFLLFFQCAPVQAQRGRPTCCSPGLRLSRPQRHGENDVKLLLV